MNYRIIRVININFENVFNYFYKKKIKENNFENFKKSFFDQNYPWCNSFSDRMSEIGNQSVDIIYNFEEMQNMWSAEYSTNNNINFQNNLEERLFLIFLEQIKFYKPEVLFFQHGAPFSSEKLKFIKEKFKFIKKIIFHNGYLLSKDELKNVDVIFASLPIYKSYYQDLGIKSYLVYHYFDETILDKISFKQKKQNRVIFCGKTGSDGHENYSFRFNLLKELLFENYFSIHSVELGRSLLVKKDFKHSLRDYIIKKSKFFPKPVLNFIINNLNNNKIKRLFIDIKNRPKVKNYLHDLYPEKIIKCVYGVEMFQLLRDHNFSLNIHSDQSGIDCGNLRMFEVTGVGSCLLTEYKSNIKDLFDPEQEVVTYKSKDELLSKLNNIKNNNKIIQEIAQNGQRRNLANHTTSIRIREIDKLVQNEL